MKNLLNLIVFSFLLLVLAACSNGNLEGNSKKSKGKPDVDVELTMTAWGNPAEQEVYRRALKAYAEINPNVHVELIPAPGDTYRQQLFTQLQGSQAPDLFYVGSEYMSQLIKTGTLVELSEFLESDESYVKPDEFSEGVWGPSRTEEGIFGTAVDNNPMLIYYNKNVLEEAGIDPNEPQKLYEAGKWNWKKFSELSEEVVKAGKYGFVAENSVAHHFSWIWTNRGEMHAENGDIILSENKEAQEAFKYLADNIEKGNFTYAGSLPEGQGPDAMFMSNQTAFVAAGRWLTPMFSENESLKFDYIPWPTNTDKKLEKAVIATAYLSVGKDSKNVEEAMKFLSFYTSEEGQRARLEDDGNAVPSVIGADDIIEKAIIPEHASYLIDAREVGQVEDRQSKIPGLDEEINSILDLLFLGQADFNETIEKITKKGQKVIDEYRSEK